MKAIVLTTLLITAPSLAVRADTHAGWHDLTNLQSWVDGNGKPVEAGKWAAKDGILHLTVKGGGNLYTAKAYGDFELLFEWKIAPGGNSGVKYRMTNYEGRGMLGAEYQVYDDGAKPFSKGATASLYDIVAPDEKTKKMNPVGEWNRSRIVVKGNHIQHFLNGKKVVDITAGTPAWKKAVDNSKFRNLEGFAQKAGPLMLQDHGSEAWFRAMKVREL